MNNNTPRESSDQDLSTRESHQQAEEKSSVPKLPEETTTKVDDSLEKVESEKEPGAEQSNLSTEELPSSENEGNLKTPQPPAQPEERETMLHNDNSQSASQEKEIEDAQSLSEKSFPEKETLFKKLASTSWYKTKGPLILAGACGIALILLITVIFQASANGNLTAQNANMARNIEQLKKEKETLQGKSDQQSTTIKQLEEENDELKFGKVRRLELVQAAHKDGDWQKTINLAAELHTAYPGSAEDTEGQKLKSAAENKIKEAEEAKKKAAEEEARKKAEEEARGYETGITFDQLARNPKDYIGKKVKFSGKVIQVQNSADEVQIRLAINNNYDQVILAYYTTVMGASMTVPLVSIKKIDQ